MSYKILLKLSFFHIEKVFIFQILDRGFILHPGSYMRDYWNVGTSVQCAVCSVKCEV